MLNKQILKAKLIKAYRILGVHPWASIEVINAAKSAMLKKYHPDKNREGLAKFSEAICKAVGEAHSIIVEYRGERLFDKEKFFTMLKRSGVSHGSS